jgi:hypothetical protein
VRLRAESLAAIWRFVDYEEIAYDLESGAVDPSSRNAAAATQSKKMIGV